MYPSRVHRNCYERKCADCDLCIKRHDDDDAEGVRLIAKDFLILRDFGIVTMINVGFALVSTLFVLPPLIVLIDSWQSRKELKARHKSKRRAKVIDKQTSELPAVE